MELIYLDNNATTPLCAEAKKQLQNYLDLPLNASSTHQLGRKAQQLQREACMSFAQFMHCNSEQILFTSSATEAINSYLWAVQNLHATGTILTCISEHSCTLEPLKRMEKLGWKIELLPVDTTGAIDLDDLKKRLNPSVKLLAFMAVNNETGARHPLEEIASLAASYKIDLLVDAVASAGKQPTTMHQGISAMVISAHKFHGPSGLGVLAVRSPLSLPPFIVGGGQQLNRRSGTLCLPLILASQAAMESYRSQSEAIHIHLDQLRERFEKLLTGRVGAQINGPAQRWGNVSNLYFPKADAETLLIQLDQAGVIASHGSACMAGSMELSHVLIAMHGRERARSSLRFSFSRMNTLEEIEKAAYLIEKALVAQRSW